MGKKKRMALIVLGAGVCLVTIFFFLLKLGFENDLMDGIIAQDEVLIRTQLADTFVAKYETRNFPKLLTTVEIYDLHHNQLGSYHLRDYFQEPQFPVLFDQPNLRIYQTPGGIIYKDRTGRFNGVQFTWITAEDFIENPELVEVAKILIETKEWRWLRAFGRFPVIFGDDEVRNILVRYSLGRFTEEELAINQDSKLTKADMIIFAQQVLEEYKRYEVEIIDENKVITFADKNLERVVREKISKPAGEIKFSEVQGITVLDAGDLPLPRHRFHDVSNPEIHEKAIVSLDGLRYLTNLQELNLSRNPISDLSELKYLKKLTKLELATIYLHQEGESDLSPLSELTLKHLGLFSNHIADISPLASLVNLEYLDLSHNEIRDITPIANLTNLRELNLGFNHIEDISPLSSLTKLQKLHLSELGVEDLAPLANLKNLEYLVLFSLPVKSIDVLSNLKNLTTLQLSYLEAKTEDLFILKKLKKLTSLSLQGFTIEDLSFLESLNQLTELDLTANHIKDISTLANLTELEKLSLCNNPVSDFSILLKLKNLTNLDLSYISSLQEDDVSSLRSLENLEKLDLSGFIIEDLSCLDGFDNLLELYLISCDLEEINTLPRLEKLEKLELRFNRITDIRPLLEFNNLREVNLFHNKCEAEKETEYMEVVENLRSRGVEVILEY